MPVLRLVFFLLLFCVPLTGHPGVTVSDFPGNTVWYAHADLEQMRSTASGKDLYGWLNGMCVPDRVAGEIGNRDARMRGRTQIQSFTTAKSS